MSAGVFKRGVLTAACAYMHVRFCVRRARIRVRRQSARRSRRDAGSEVCRTEVARFGVITWVSERNDPTAFHAGTPCLLLSDVSVIDGLNFPPAS